VALQWNPAWSGACEWHAARVAAGEFWRIATGHWTHWSWNHLFWDVLAFVVLFPAALRFGGRRALAVLALAALAVPAVLACASPGLIRYRGLSGLDTALFAFVSTAALREALLRRDRTGTAMGAALLAGLGLKIGYECLSGGALFATDLGAGVTPVPAAHVAGAAAGLLAALPPRRMPARSPALQPAASRMAVM
jgi:rhomboid family GlyGly-CTERM serine protease